MNNHEMETFLTQVLATAIEGAARDVIVPHAIEHTPRIESRWPKPLKIGGDRPKYKSNGRRAVQGPDGNWYAGVTGNLKRSIDAVRQGNITQVGVVAEGPVKSTDYAEYLEFGTRYIAPFHFITNAIHTDSQQKKLLQRAEEYFAKLIS